MELGIVFGGRSSEYEVSLKSAYSVLCNIDYEKYTVHRIYITRDGRQFYYKGDNTALLNDNININDCMHCIISSDASHHGVMILENNLIIRLDCVFPVLHGKNGEDGTIQGLLELSGIPFVGSNALSSAMCMDKSVTHTILDNAKIKNAKWKSIFNHQYYKDSREIAKSFIEYLGLPVFVKPANAGSSVGVTKASTFDELLDSMDEAFKYDNKVVVESMLVGKEIECAVMGNTAPVTAKCGEIVPCNDFYDYNAKYVDNKSEIIIPARINDDVMDKVREIAINAYEALNCAGLARVDFFVDGDNITLNEINTIPGFTEISMYAKMWECSGVLYPDLIDMLIGFAIDK